MPATRQIRSWSRGETGRATEVCRRRLCAFPPVAGTHILADAGYLTPMPHLPNEYPDEPEPCGDDGHDDVAEKAKEAVSLGHGRAFRLVSIVVPKPTSLQAASAVHYSLSAVQSDLWAFIVQRFE